MVIASFSIIDISSLLPLIIGLFDNANFVPTLPMNDMPLSSPPIIVPPVISRFPYEDIPPMHLDHATVYGNSCSAISFYSIHFDCYISAVNSDRTEAR